MPGIGSGYACDPRRVFGAVYGAGVLLDNPVRALGVSVVFPLAFIDFLKPACAVAVAFNVNVRPRVLRGLDCIFTRIDAGPGARSLNLPLIIGRMRGNLFREARSTAGAAFSFSIGPDTIFFLLSPPVAPGRVSSLRCGVVSFRCPRNFPGIFSHRLPDTHPRYAIPSTRTVPEVEVISCGKYL